MSADNKGSSSSSTSSQPNFYFLKNRASHPKLLDTGGGTASVDYNSINSEAPAPIALSAPSNSWWSNLFHRSSSHQYHAVEGVRSRPRQIPVKVEPKVYFANERTFLSWMNMSVTLASISMAIVAFADANEWSQVYGLMLLPVSVLFAAYSLVVYIRRSAMIRRKDPGPYEDRYGPVVLALMLGLLIATNFAMKIYSYSSWAQQY